ncbi:hypothetical protein HAX54_022487 [Datura stramonium]|uniref:Uncharacterized protein n=1 Tax=Datura stramonium TaxID=4076 RepID=A0ABS8UVW5_DATST|nr:hypothetical protein [Datura stramonium]
MVKIPSQVILFEAPHLTGILRIPNIDPHPIHQHNFTPPYAEIWSQDLEEEALDHRPRVEWLTMDVKKTKVLDTTYGPIFTLAERHAQDDSYAIEHARAMCRIGLAFVELVDDDVPTDEERHREDLDIESDDDEADYSNLDKEAFAPDEEIETIF